MMKLLAIDTSTELASVATLIDNEIISREQDSQRIHAQLILPMIDELVAQTGLGLNQLDGIIFGCGPGSFTGLRIACSIAKGLAYANDLPLVPVSSLAAIAWTAREIKEDFNQPVLSVLDARMHEMYWSCFLEQQFLAQDRINAVKDIQLPANQSFILAGVGIDLYWKDFPEQIKSQISEVLTVFPTASAMIRLAQKANIKAVSVAQAQPVYVRNQVTQGDSRG
ncbi:tRNA (adenosine(37)-N6)-threonylcarbamoyltransferase complex dimerization subunit type 1 TsaB [Legionella pneumophila]|uniref:tRNA (adenosine(37)-N6)-threonylcarbamoyltransferase complex dimerization subunit type 1 TsaB n=1 Tax=Legionella pneumophila TaxID=446 RepID=UPI000D0584D9|nr:tRNA (adenosine(37)-N6)-threonylcarbamoyltransferase complex dimerization subunit type 1 TsaB [Legionella pneumophila]RYX20727.1 tRNA (adenosine(37)-N6)-threonylcarbamoyltransferase complex dimerization subunit type 1 TsaB [Legionella pneumophila]RYX25454.1 tRNA (adenosine(37)-N6)-threonylcarbamoyltransferase complex dimerization subunit type 1 TsaB [Legionella pneumophila]HAT1758163.1 tRNA (adenosine(37)-N6)-threonylcarbamoyltransferase complex dimerization subunit type 1 TsaB [Legionella pn